MSARSWRPPASNWLIESLRCLIIFSMIAVTCASFSSMRSSTSLRLISALIRRMVPSLVASLARIAAFMSSVICSFRLMPISPSGTHKAARRRQTQKPAADTYRSGFAKHGTQNRAPAESVHLLGQLLAADALVVALHGSGELALAFCSRLLVKLTRTQL